MPSDQTSSPQLDSSYHFPADVFELLVEVIPYLCKSKPAIIDFFRGAGVPEKYLANWRKELAAHRDEVKKAVMSRDILRALNEAGDGMLAQRREIVKRASSFEDFSSCWPDDRYKAEALVGRVRQIVHVKDSFTRMEIEKERARKERQDAHVAVVQALRRKTEQRESLKGALSALFSMSNPQKRGKALEGVLNRLFEMSGLKVREAFTVRSGASGIATEQIDGAVELDGHTYVVEMKWLKEKVGPELGQHCARVMVRPPDVRAIYISASGYTEAAIQIAREFLSHRLCILVELEELYTCLQQDGDVVELLRAKVSRAMLQKEVLYRPGSQ
jgi:restriction system protein